MTSLPLTVLARNSLKVTVGWNPPAGVTGYIFWRDGRRVSSSFDPSKNQVTFGIPDGQPHTFTVTALSDLAEGAVAVNSQLRVAVAGTSKQGEILKAVIS